MVAVDLAAAFHPVGALCGVLGPNAGVGGGEEGGIEELVVLVGQ